MMHLRTLSITIDPEHGRRDAAGLAGDFQTIALRAQRQARAACSTPGPAYSAGTAMRRCKYKLTD
jgi:hypothetical protein